MTTYQRLGQAYVRSVGVQTPVLPAGFYQGATSPDHGTYFNTYYPQTDQLITVPGTAADTITDDITAFFATGPAYATYNMTHKRGYILHGPPGAGKSSLAMMISRRFVTEKNGLVLYADNLNQFLSNIASRDSLEWDRPALFMMEELDGWANDARVLNALDGGRASTATVFLGMTNYLGKLPGRILNRPGRFDRVEKIDRIPYQVQLEFLRRIQARDPAGPQVAEEIVNAMEGYPVTMAHLKEAWVAHVILGRPLGDIRINYDRMYAALKQETQAVGIDW